MRIKKRKERIRRRKKKIIYSILTVIWFLGLWQVGWCFGYNKFDTKANIALKGNNVINGEVKDNVKLNEEVQEELNKETTEKIDEEKSILVAEENEEVKEEQIEEQIEEEKVSETEASKQDIFFANPSETLEENKDLVHNHTLVDITEEINHKETGHFENVLITPESVEIVPIYAVKELSICNGCGADITTDPMEHIESRKQSGYLECNGYNTEWREEQIDSREEVTPEVYDKVWIVDKEAWTETKVVGQKCTSCGEVIN